MSVSPNGNAAYAKAEAAERFINSWRSKSYALIGRKGSGKTVYLAMLYRQSLLGISTVVRNDGVTTQWEAQFEGKRDPHGTTIRYLKAHLQKIEEESKWPDPTNTIYPLLFKLTFTRNKKSKSRFIRIYDSSGALLEKDISKDKIATGEQKMLAKILAEWGRAKVWIITVPWANAADETTPALELCRYLLDRKQLRPKAIAFVTPDTDLAGSDSNPKATVLKNYDSVVQYMQSSHEKISFNFIPAKSLGDKFVKNKKHLPPACQTATDSDPKHICRNCQILPGGFPTPSGLFDPWDYLSDYPKGGFKSYRFLVQIFLCCIPLLVVLAIVGVRSYRSANENWQQVSALAASPSLRSADAPAIVEGAEALHRSWLFCCCRKDNLQQAEIWKADARGYLRLCENLKKTPLSGSPATYRYGVLFAFTNLCSDSRWLAFVQDRQTIVDQYRLFRTGDTTIEATDRIRELALWCKDKNHGLISADEEASAQAALQAGSAWAQTEKLHVAKIAVEENEAVWPKATKRINDLAIETSANLRLVRDYPAFGPLVSAPLEADAALLALLDQLDTFRKLASDRPTDKLLHVREGIANWEKFIQDSHEPALQSKAKDQLKQWERREAELGIAEFNTDSAIRITDKLTELEDCLEKIQKWKLSFPDLRTKIDPEAWSALIGQHRKSRAEMERAQLPLLDRLFAQADPWDDVDRAVRAWNNFRENYGDTPASKAAEKNLLFVDNLEALSQKKNRLTRDASLEKILENLEPDEVQEKVNQHRQFSSATDFIPGFEKTPEARRLADELDRAETHRKQLLRLKDIHLRAEPPVRFELVHGLLAELAELKSASLSPTLAKEIQVSQDKLIDRRELNLYLTELVDTEPHWLPEFLRFRKKERSYIVQIGYQDEHPDGDSNKKNYETRDVGLFRIGDKINYYHITLTFRQDLRLYIKLRPADSSPGAAQLPTLEHVFSPEDHFKTPVSPISFGENALELHFSTTDH